MKCDSIKEKYDRKRKKEGVGRKENNTPIYGEEGLEMDELAGIWEEIGVRKGGK